MSTTSWISDWTAEDPVDIGFVSVARDDGEWVRDSDMPLERRNLGLDRVSAGKLGVTHVRTVGMEPFETGWHAHDVDFECFYILDGRLEIESENGEKLTLGRGDAGYHPGLHRHRTTVSPGFEAVVIASPASGTRFTGLHAELPAQAAADPNTRGVYSFERPESYSLGAGPRKFFRYRDLGTAGPSDGRLHIHVVRATEPGAGTGWHYHSMAQWFMILGGSSIIRVESMPSVQLRERDSMCIGRGPAMRHNVAPFSGDYAVLEMCVPATYETIAVAAPEDCDRPPAGARE